MQTQNNTLTEGAILDSLGQHSGLINLIFHCLLRDEAEMEYLKIAQDLEMYGVSYFAITVSVNYCVLIMSDKVYLTHYLKRYWHADVNFFDARHLNSKTRETLTCCLEWMLRAFTSTAPPANSILTSLFPGVASETSLTVKKR